MRGWLTGLGIAAAVMIASWVVLVLLARRLPEGTAKELARFLPACVTTARRLRVNPAVPRRAKLAVGFAGLWVLSPIDLIPEFLPVIGPLDDVVVVALALRYAARQVPREVLLEAWPGDRRIIERLLGPPRATSAPIDRER
ncbi:YkvA family protein [Geodermatophilus sp. URMC 64]